MDKEEIEKIYEDEKKAAEKEFLTGKLQKEQLFRRRMIKARKKYIQLYIKNIKTEKRQMIKDAKKIKPLKPEKAENEQILQKSQKPQKKFELQEFKLKLKARNIYIKILPRLYPVKKWKAIISNEISYMRLVSAYRIKRAYTKIKENTKKLLMKIKEIAKKTFQLFKKIMPKRIKSRSEEKKEDKKKGKN